MTILFSNMSNRAAVALPKIVTPAGLRKKNICSGAVHLVFLLSFLFPMHSTLLVYG